MEGLEKWSLFLAACKKCQIGTALFQWRYIRGNFFKAILLLPILESAPKWSIGVAFHKSNLRDICKHGKIFTSNAWKGLHEGGVNWWNAICEWDLARFMALRNSAGFDRSEIEVSERAWLSRSMVRGSWWFDHTWSLKTHYLHQFFRDGLLRQVWGETNLDLEFVKMGLKFNLDWISGFYYADPVEQLLWRWLLRMWL